MSDFYEILGVSKEADAVEIKKAYRKLSLVYHPDKTGSNEEATQTFQKINEAYETLGDEQKRKNYDYKTKIKQKNDGFPMQGFPPNFPFNVQHHSFGGHPMDSMFEQFFNMHQSGPGPNIRIFHNGIPVQRAPRKPKPTVICLNLSLDQVYTGCKASVAYVKKVDNQEVPSSIDIDIPPSIKDNEIIVVNNLGDETEDHMAGDLHITVKITNHPVFRRHNMNLHMTKQITLKEALCGFSVEIPHLNGKTIRISNLNQQNVVKPGFVREINHFGMLDKNDPSKNGKLILDFEIIFPETLTEEQKKTIAYVL